MALRVRLGVKGMQSRRRALPQLQRENIAAMVSRLRMYVYGRKVGQPGEVPRSTLPLGKRHLPCYLGIVGRPSSHVDPIRLRPCKLVTSICVRYA